VIIFEIAVAKDNTRKGAGVIEEPFLLKVEVLVML